VGSTIFAPHLSGPIFRGPDGSASSTSEQDFLLVVSTDLHGVRTLVSGVEEINTLPEDPIVHLSSPVPGRGISGRDPLLVVSIVAAQKK
jgi:hypothetical protein